MDLEGISRSFRLLERGDEGKIEDEGVIMKTLYAEQRSADCKTEPLSNFTRGSDSLISKTERSLRTYTGKCSPVSGAGECCLVLSGSPQYRVSSRRAGYLW